MSSTTSPKLGVDPSALVVAFQLERFLVEITVPDLRSVALAGNPKVKVPAIARDTFGISITGTGAAEVAGATRHVTVKVAGAPVGETDCAVVP